MVVSELGVWTIAILEITCLVAYFLKGFSGFGPALIFIPVVAYLLNPKLALTGSAFIDLFVGIALLFTSRYSRSDWLLIAKICSCMIVGIIIGGYLVSTMPMETVLAIIAVLVFLVGVNLIVFSRSAPIGIRIKHPMVIYIGSLLSGIGGGLAGIAGPFIIMVTKPTMDKSSFRRIMVAVFLVGGLVRLIVYSSVNMWSHDVLTLSLIVAPSIIVGLIVGTLIHFKINEVWFSRSIGMALIAIAVKIGLSIL